MTHRRPLLALALAASTLAAGVPALADPPVRRVASPRLVPVGSAAGLRALVAPLVAERLRQRREMARMMRGAMRGPPRPTASDTGGSMAPPAPTASATSAAPARGASASTTPAAAGRAGADDGITNNQEQGVDEGDIVKARGDVLVVLRRGRLFTVRLGDRTMTPVSVVDAFAPGAQPAEWYDEMLVDGDTVLVIGYSYSGGGTEVARFHLDAGGRLAYRDTLFVRSGDYYSSRNYASRLVGHRLVVYMPVPMFDDERLRVVTPSWRVGRRGAWAPMLDYARVYRPLQYAGEYPTLHTVLSCDVGSARMRCTAEGVVGPDARTFYVSSRAVYLWVQGEDPATWGADGDLDRLQRAARRRPWVTGSVVYRFPLDGAGGRGVGAVRARGGPVDQFSFREEGEELQVLLRAESGGDGMWSPEVSAGDVGLVRVPLASFGTTVGEVAAARYRRLPSPRAGATLQNRFVGGHVLYGVGDGWRRDAAAHGAPSVFVHALATGETATLDLAHVVDRIEPMGRDAVVVGTAGNDLRFSAVALDARPALAGTYVREGAAQGETRSHGFFYLPEGDRAGTLGLPVRVQHREGWRQLRHGAAEVLFLRVSALRFSPLGALASRREEGTDADDRCVASCADWYGNARPIFYRGRVFALMGYELVEGQVADGALREQARVDVLAALREALPPPPPPRPDEE